RGWLQSLGVLRTRRDRRLLVQSGRARCHHRVSLQCHQQCTRPGRDWLAAEAPGMIESLRIRAQVANELETYVCEGAERGRRVGPRWPARRVTECIEKRKHKLVVPYRSLLRIPESDRRPETARLSWDVWIVWKDGAYLVFFASVTEHYG